MRFRYAHFLCAIIEKLFMSYQWLIIITKLCWSSLLKAISLFLFSSFSLFFCRLSSIFLMCFVIPSLQSSKNYFWANAFVFLCVCPIHLLHHKRKHFIHFFILYFHFLFTTLVIRYISNFFFTEVVYLIFKIALEIKMHQLKMYFSMSFLIFRNNTVKQTLAIGKRYLVATLEAA